MFYLKACPKCNGDLFKDSDVYGLYIACMQCGHYLTNAEETQLDRFGLSLALQPATVVQQEKIAA